MNKSMMLVVAVGVLASCHTATQKDMKDFAGNWIEVMPANTQYVQGVTLNTDGTASSIGMATLKYDSWSLSDDRLILNGKSIGNGQTLDFSDTLDVVNLTTDSMTLGRFGSYRIGYYRLTPPTQGDKTLIDSLQQAEGTGKLQMRVYRGTLPAASCPGIVYNITLTTMNIAAMVCSGHNSLIWRPTMDRIRHPNFAVVNIPYAETRQTRMPSYSSLYLLIRTRKP